MRKLTVFLLILCLAAIAASPASAAKKKKGPKPYTSEEVSIAAGHAAFYGTSGTLLSVTAQEFINTCAIPGSNGVDAYVFEVPADYQGIDSAISAFGSGSTTGHDLDIYLADESCAITMAWNSTNVDETGIVPKGTAYILLHSFGTGASPAGGGDTVTAHFELKPL